MNTPNHPHRGKRASTAGAKFEVKIEENLEKSGFKKLDKRIIPLDKNSQKRFKDFITYCKKANGRCFIYQYRPICDGIYARGNGIACDFLIYEPSVFPNGLAIEAKWQDSLGSVEEKFPYLVENIKQYPCDAVIVCGGNGATPGAILWLKNQAGKAENLIEVFLNLEDFKDWLKKKLS